jgi:hypothetical protein
MLRVVIHYSYRSDDCGEATRLVENVEINERGCQTRVLRLF